MAATSKYGGQCCVFLSSDGKKFGNQVEIVAFSVSPWSSEGMMVSDDVEDVGIV